MISQLRTHADMRETCARYFGSTCPVTMLHMNQSAVSRRSRAVMTENAGRKQGGGGNHKRFAKGQSGNPAGKPAGTRNATTLAVEQLLHGEAEAITRKAIEMAKEGDTIALRLVLERVAPVRRG